MKAETALQRLLEGNRRFAADQPLHPRRGPHRRREISQGQEPFAIVLGCADSRVPPTLVFDCGLGDLFVIRTAGHVVDEVVLGSMSYGVEVLEIPLLVVLGHSRCGAVQAAVQSTGGNQASSTALARLVDKLRQAVNDPAGRQGDLLESAVRANVELTVEQIISSQPFSQAAAHGRLQVLGAYYDLSTGTIELMDVITSTPTHWEE